MHTELSGYKLLTFVGKIKIKDTNKGIKIKILQIMQTTGSRHKPILSINRNPALGAYMRQIYHNLLYQYNTLVITTAYGAVV